MRNVSCRTQCKAIRGQLAEIRLSERARQRAAYALRRADTILDAVTWFKEGIESLGAMRPKPAYKKTLGGETKSHA